MRTTIFACVLRSGGDFDPSWVRALNRGLQEHVPGAPLVCLTDYPQGSFGEGVFRVPLRYNWPGWWSKLELLRDSIFPWGAWIFYVDLDTLFVGPPRDLLSYEGDFAMHRGFYHPERLQSGIMIFRAGSTVARQFWARWARNPESHMQRFRGDGDFLDDHGRPYVDVLPDLFPSRIVSLKVHAREGIPDRARIVCGHGRPRFTDPAAGWAHEHWTRLAQ